MPTVLETSLVRTPEICGGCFAIDGTRMTVNQIVAAEQERLYRSAGCRAVSATHFGRDSHRPRLVLRTSGRIRQGTGARGRG